MCTFFFLSTALIFLMIIKFHVTQRSSNPQRFLFTLNNTNLIQILGLQDFVCAYVFHWNTTNDENKLNFFKLNILNVITDICEIVHFNVVYINGNYINYMFNVVTFSWFDFSLQIKFWYVPSIGLLLTS